MQLASKKGIAIKTKPPVCSGAAKVLFCAG